MTKGVRGKTGTDVGRVVAPNFDGQTSWAAVRRQFETVEELCTLRKSHASACCSASDVLREDPKEATYEETIEALTDRFGDQHLAAAYRTQFKTRTKPTGQSPSWSLPPRLSDTNGGHQERTRQGIRRRRRAPRYKITAALGR